MAADRLAHQLLKMTTDPNVADPVKLAAIKDALDRSGIQAKTAVTVEVSTKPYELVFDRIARDRETKRRPGNQNTYAAIESGDDDEILGEFDDPPPDHEIGDYSSGIQRQRERDSADVIDVEIVADEYTDAPMSRDPAPLTRTTPIRRGAAIWGRLSIRIPASDLSDLRDQRAAG